MFAEWEKQKGIVLIYPHVFCDFEANLEEVQDCYDNIIAEILKVESVYLIMHPKDNEAKERVQELLRNIGEEAKNCRIFEFESNDVWARDSIALSVKEQTTSQKVTNLANAMFGANSVKSESLGFLDKVIRQDSENETIHHQFANFIFNAWGLKYSANFDNQLNVKLHQVGFFDMLKTYGMVLEGGSIDYNGNGILLTTRKCLLEPNRNPNLTKEQIEESLKSYLHVSKILWLEHGELLGDDTDSHIDTLARFINHDTIVYIQCDDLQNPNFTELNAMKHELENLAKVNNFKLIALPFCEYPNDILIESDTDLHRQIKQNKPYLPASYANFLFLNDNTLLLPIYNKPTDFSAIEIMKKALPEYNIIPINCEALIQQYGSLHCITMQIH
ncbi:agmatine deiminase family protein [Helicobacter didelphidarum]|uniref:Agmatine deiminase family protein n=1 Tax=Helicobacter didelphidarum TaxID=2040648 RepID=A0A3D8IM26_9HELI|nr:agmatine deiminase family protein [Helicobacter didelphidarum]RDU66232.1 agmatine deiminase family protein [Helicobacter didelphidarum]